MGHDSIDINYWPRPWWRDAIAAIPGAVGPGCIRASLNRCVARDPNVWIVNVKIESATMTFVLFRSWSDVARVPGTNDFAARYRNGTTARYRLHGYAAGTRSTPLRYHAGVFQYERIPEARA